MYVVENIINILTAFSLRDGYLLSSNIQNCASDCILYLDNRVVSQHNPIRHSFSQELRLHEWISSAKGLLIHRFPHAEGNNNQSFQLIPLSVEL